MSLTSSLNSALAGLDLTSRRADIVARNVANSDAPGYARRGLEGSGRAGLPGSGVSVARLVDPRLTQLRREAQSREAGSAVVQTFGADLDAALGDPDQAGSLQDALGRFDAALVSAAADPNAPTRLGEIASAADALAARLNGIDGVIQDGRQKADTDIGRAVDQLNADLGQVERLNTDIRRLAAGGHDTADLVDRRTLVVDRISTTVPVRELLRDNGSVALVSEGGLLLLDGRPVTVGFAPRAPITAAMSVPIQLSGLTVNGRDALTAGTASGIRGGALEALFALRDVIAPDATALLDGVAAELIGRFEAQAVDDTVAPGSPGLFTDDGAPFSLTAPKGLAGRIAVNDAVAVDRPEGHWRLRDGLGATGPGSGGDAALLLRYGAAFARSATPLVAGLPAVAADVPGHAAGLRSLVSAARVEADDRLAYHRSLAEDRGERRDGGGVDIDAEMRRLVELEQAYAANARVMQAVADMMNRLTEL